MKTLSLLSETANRAVDLMVERILEDVMHGFELEEQETNPLTPEKDQTPQVAAPWETRLLHQICPHKPLTYSRANLLAVAGLLITGALVVYMTALHMGYLNSDEAALLLAFNQSLPYFNTSRTDPPPTYVNDSGLSANSSVGNQSALDYNSSYGDTAEESSLAANVSILDSSSEAVGNTDSWVLPPPPPPPPPSPSPPPLDEIYYQNMSETWHTMKDRDLLRKASTMPPRWGPNGGRVAFMFMTRGPLPFAPLWERYFRGHGEFYSIYVHAHPAYVPTVAATSPFFRRFIPSKEVQWGKLSVYEAERRLLGNALLTQSNEWFLLISESCIPIFDFPETYRYLNNSLGISFIESYKDSTRTGQGRLYRGKFQDMEPEITQKNFRKGSQWFQINRDLALLAAADSEEYAKFEKGFCKIHPVCYIDEHFLPTFAWVKRPNAIAFRTLTYYEFHGKSPHPKTFGKEEIDPKLIKNFRGGRRFNCTYNRQETSQCYLFVRKFAPDTLDELLELAGPVMEIP